MIINNRKGLTIAFSIFVFILFSFFSSATIVTDWREYSPVNTYITNANDLNSQGFFNLNYSAVTKDYSGAGLSTPTDDIEKFGTELTTKIIGSNEYIFFTDGEFLQVMDQNLNILNTTHSGGQRYSLSIFGITNKSAEILGVFINATGTFFSVYDFSTETNNLTLRRTTEITPGQYTSSIKCISNGLAYFNYNGAVCLAFSENNLISSYLWTMKDNGTITNTLINTNPIASSTALKGISIVDANNDGKLEILGNNEGAIVLLNLTGGTIFLKPRNSGYFFSDAKFFHNTPTTYKIIYTQSLISSSTSYEFGFLSLDGSNFGGSASTIATGGNNEIVAGDPVVLDFYHTGTDFIAIPYSNSTGSTINLYNTAKTINASYGFSGVAMGGGSYYYGGYSIGAKLNGDNYPDFMLMPYNPYGNMYLVDIINKNIILSRSGNYIPTDINIDGATELLGYNNTGLILLTSSYVNQFPVINGISYTPSSPAVNSLVTITINATDPENDIIFYYLDCGNGIISNETQIPSFNCRYNVTGDFTATAYVRDQFKSSYSSSQIVVHVGTLSNLQESGIVGQIVNSLLSTFPDASNLSLGQRLGIVFVVMFLTAVIILFASSQLTSEGIHQFIVYVVFILLLIEFVFFIAISYIPIEWLVVLVLIGITFAYFGLRKGR